MARYARSQGKGPAKKKRKDKLKASVHFIANEKDDTLTTIEKNDGNPRVTSEEISPYVDKYMGGKDPGIRIKQLEGRGSANPIKGGGKGATRTTKGKANTYRYQYNKLKRSR